MHPRHAQLAQMLKSHRQSLTKPRSKVFDILLNNEPLSVADIILKARDTVDRASIYRTISLFENLGIIQRLQIGWKYKLELSNTFQAHHHHFSCLQCESVIAISEDPTIEKRLHALALQYDIKITDHQLEIRGLCSACQRKKRSGG